MYRDANNVLSGYGWLSFNETSGCPGGSCAATFDPATNKLLGWAKFLAADPTNGSWDGWVSLNSLNKSEQVTYAVEYNPMTGKFIPGTTGNTSWAWGSNVTGWMTFYDVSMGAVTTAMTITNLKATPLDCVNNNPNNCPVRLEWTNPRAFNGTDLYRYEGSNPCRGVSGSALTACKNANFIKFKDDLATSTGAQSYDVNNLPQKSTNSFFIKGSY